MDGTTESCEGLLADGVLPFEDGSLRGTAGMIVWLCILLRYKEFPDHLQNNQVQVLIKSLLEIPSMLDISSTTANRMESTIAWIARQNSVAKTQSVSSFQWAGVLKELSGTAWTDSTVQEMVNLYNDHPDVPRHVYRFRHFYRLRWASFVLIENAMHTLRWLWTCN